MKIVWWFLLLLLLSALLSAAAPSGPGFAENKKKPDVAVYIKLLDNNLPTVRKIAMKGVRNVFLAARRSKEIDKESDLIKALERRLTDSERSIRYFAAAELLFLDRYYDVSADRGAIIDLCIEALNEPVDGDDMDLKVMALPGLNIIERIIINLGNFREKLGAKKDEVISALKKNLNNRYNPIRYEAAVALGELDYINNKHLIIPVFLEALYDPDEDAAVSIRARMLILKTCKSIGPEAREALPGLLHVTKNEIKKWGGGLILPPIYIGTLESVTALPISLIMINDVLTYPIANIFIAFCFGGLFCRSIKVREKGEKTFHWLLPVPALFYAGYFVYNIFTKRNSSFELMYNYKIFMLLALVGLIPWLTSWAIIWARDKKKTLSSS